MRALTATLLYASPDEIAVTASVSAGLNALASALHFSAPRDTVVISDFEFPTNAQIWHAQEPRGARIVHVPCTLDGYIPLEHIAKVIDERTQLVAITHVCFRNGAKLDIPGIVRLAHAKGAMVHIQSLMPTSSGWFAQADIGAMDINANRPAPSARRFEAGTPAVVNCYAAEAGLKFLLAVGTPAIERRHCRRAVPRQRRPDGGTRSAKHRHLAPRRQCARELSFLQQRGRRGVPHCRDASAARFVRRKVGAATVNLPQSLR